MYNYRFQFFNHPVEFQLQYNFPNMHSSKIWTLVLLACILVVCSTQSNSSSNISIPQDFKDQITNFLLALQKWNTTQANQLSDNLTTSMFRLYVMLVDYHQQGSTTQSQINAQVVIVLNILDQIVDIINGNANGQVKGNSNLVLGQGNTVSGNKNAVVGNDNTAIGNKNKLYGDGNIAQGNNIKISGDNSLIVGNNNNVKGSNDIVFGHSINLQQSNTLQLDSYNVDLTSISQSN